METMGKVIYKYNLSQGTNTIKLPKGYEIISTIEQHDTIVMYALVDYHDDESKLDYEFVDFVVLGTGWVIENGEMFDSLEFIDTVSTFGGGLIWHVFKAKEKGFDLVEI